MRSLMSLEDTTIGILASNEFEDIELEYPLLQLSHEGADIVLIPVQAGHHPRPSLESVGTKPVTGRYGTPLPPDVIKEGNRYVVKDLSEIEPDDLDAVFIPGGFSPDHLRTHEGAVQFVREVADQGKIVSAICHGPWMFVETELADGIEITAYEAVHNDLENAGATVVDVPSTRDGNIVTGRQPDDLPEFCEELAAALAERAAEQQPAD